MTQNNFYFLQKIKLVFLILLWLTIITSGLKAQVYINMSAAAQTITCPVVGSLIFRDPGGAANYANNANVTQTFSSNNGQCIRFNFTSFNTQGGNDFLYIYDGANTLAPNIGTYSGNNNLTGAITSSTGSLTFVFTSNAATTRAGWEATITCVACASAINFPAGTNTMNGCSFVFYDSGGLLSNYSANENRTLSFCSNIVGMCIKAEFLNFDVASGDVLRIYNGPNTASPQFGLYDNTTPPPTALLSQTGCITFNFTSNNSNQNAGWTCIISCEVCPSAPAGVATYTLGTVGQQNTFLANQMVNTCSGTFTDNGGIGANYADNIGGYLGLFTEEGFYRTFCPNAANKCVRASFHSFSTEGGYDWLSIRNGPTQFSPEFGTGSSWWGTPTNNTYTGLAGIGVGPYTSTDQSGCLSFSFWSDAVVNYPGWVVTLDCVPCSGPNGTDNNDCALSTLICADAPFSDASTGPGLLSETGNPNCALSENFASWYRFTILSSGTLGLIITPNVATDDYDFSLWGPNKLCNNLGAPLRCSYAENTGNTGMNNVATDFSEDVLGDAWVQQINVVAGQTYILLVNNWTPGGNGFTLDWQFGGGASMNCVPLGTEFSYFDVTLMNGVSNIKWSTANEYDVMYFDVERSANGIDFEPIVRVNSIGNSIMEQEYQALDKNFLEGTLFYRIKSVEKNGSHQYSQTRTIYKANKYSQVNLQPNPAKNTLTLTLNSGCDESAHVTVFDNNGIAIYNEDVKILSGFNQFHFDISNFDNGLYFLSLQTNKNITRLKFLKQ